MRSLVVSLAFLLLFNLSPDAQNCGNCGKTSSVALYDLEVQVPQPELKGEQTEGWNEWLQLFWYGRFAGSMLFAQNKSCIRFTQPPSAEDDDMIQVGQTYTNLPPVNQNVSRFGDYIITGHVRKAGEGYIMRMELQAACSRDLVAFAEVPFNESTSGDYTSSIAKQAVAKLSPLADKIRKFEKEQRQKNTKVAFASLESDEITIKPKKRILGPGEQTEIEVVMKDCDGQILPNREIVFVKGTIEGMSIPGTTGGTVTPARVTTDATGKAKAMFKMGSSKNAVINAHHIHDKPMGCSFAKLGSAPIGTAPVKVEITYFESERKTLKRATLPGVKITGGEETETKIMTHTSVLYHYPSATALKEGYLVIAENDNDDPNSKTEYVMEAGNYDYSKTVAPATKKSMVGNQALVMDEEKGSWEGFQGYANLQHPSQIVFFKGDAGNPAQFTWDVEYPTTDDGIAGASMVLAKDDENVKWQVKKVADQSSIYKTEYLLELKVDVAQEFAEGNKAMKDMIGLDLDGIASTIDPTNPQEDMAGASGTRWIKVRVLSPYEDK